MKNVTLAYLKEAIRQRTDTEDDDHISDSELIGYINASYTELYDILNSTVEDYYTTSIEINVPTSSGGFCNLPDDFYTMRGLDDSDGNPVTTYTFFERNKYSNNLCPSPKVSKIKYRIIGNKLKLIPEQSASGNFRLWYTPVCPTLSEDTDILNGVNGWEEYIIIDSAIKISIKKEDYPAALILVKSDIRKRIQASAGDRDQSFPETMTFSRTEDYEE